MDSPPKPKPPESPKAAASLDTSFPASPKARTGFGGEALNAGDFAADSSPVDAVVVPREKIHGCFTAEVDGAGERLGVRDRVFCTRLVSDWRLLPIGTEISDVL